MLPSIGLAEQLVWAAPLADPCGEGAPPAGWWLTGIITVEARFLAYFYRQ